MKQPINTTHKCCLVEIDNTKNDLDNYDNLDTVSNHNNKQMTTFAVITETELTKELSPEEDLTKIMKEWNSPVYAFFQPISTIEKVGE